MVEFVCMSRGFLNPLTVCILMINSVDDFIEVYLFIGDGLNAVFRYISATFTNSPVIIYTDFIPAYFFRPLQHVGGQRPIVQITVASIIGNNLACVNIQRKVIGKTFMQIVLDSSQVSRLFRCFVADFVNINIQVQQFGKFASSKIQHIKAPLNLSVWFVVLCVYIVPYFAGICQGFF